MLSGDMLQTPFISGQDSCAIAHAAAIASAKTHVIPKIPIFAHMIPSL
jgi:hypothetical protein